MSTKADFYVGRGLKAEWIGSIPWDGYPLGVPSQVKDAKSESEYREAVATFLGQRPDGVSPEMGWPWKWPTSRKSNYAYAFDDGRVWASTFGSSWWPASSQEPDHRTLKHGVARFPSPRHRGQIKVKVNSEDDFEALLVESEKEKSA